MNSLQNRTSSPPPVTLCLQCNIARESPGPTHATSAEVFNMFLDEQILDIICTFTNAEALRVVPYFNANDPPNRMRIWIDVNPVEIKAFLVS